MQGVRKVQQLDLLCLLRIQCPPVPLQAGLFHRITAGLQWREFCRAAGWGCGVCAGPSPASPAPQNPLFAIKASAGGVPSSLSPHHPHGPSPPCSPLCVQGEPAPGGFTPLLPLQAVFLPLSSFHQAANMLSEQ